jgi:crotonobetainyl-CoA:carnitine CoA-transferase CaiB-like acyl-CoA transferase
MLDLTHMLSGPYAGMILADLGVDAIKIEPPERGEGTRRLHAKDPLNSLHGMGSYFLTLNRNKKSVTIDLKAEDGLALFYELVAESDIVLSNFSAGVVDRLKISYEHLQAVNPGIICATVSGFGETGPGRDQVAFDMVAQAMGGGMSITGPFEGMPTRAGIPIGDLGGGLFGVIGVLSAVIARQTTGRGQQVDISMLDAQISMLSYMATMHFLSGEIPGPIGNNHFTHVPYDAFACQEGHIILAVITDNFWTNLLTVVDMPEFDTEENKTQPGRWKNRQLIHDRLIEVFASNTQAHWLKLLRQARIPSAPVNDFAQALNDEQVLHREMVIDVDHPSGDGYKTVGNPVKLSETGEQSFSSPPLVGQHTDEILSTILGKSEQAIARLRAAGII